MAETEMKGILSRFWICGRNCFDTMCGRNFLIGPIIDLLSILIPHRSIISSSTKGLELEEPNSKRNHKSALIDLPNEIIFDILMRLPTKSLFHIRGLSKTSLNIVDDPFFAMLHTQRLLNSATPTAPVEAAQLMLLIHIWFEHLTALQSFKYNDKHRLNKIEDSGIKIFSAPIYYKVDFVFCNLFGFSKRKGRFGDPSLLVNPLRGEVLQIPMNDLVPTKYTKFYGMGFDSITGTHKIVCIAQSVPFRSVSAYVYTLGTRSSSWREIHSVPQCKFSRKNVSAYGDMHWLIKCDEYRGHSNRIISFDFKKDEFVWIPYPNTSSQDFFHGFDAMHLLNLRGRLAILLSAYSSLELWVLKSYEGKEWTFEYKIDKKVFPPNEYGDDVSSIDTCGEWEHGIFFTEENMFYFWDARYKSIKCIKAESLFPSIFSYDNSPKLRIINYTRSLISLKRYGNLVNRQASRWQILETKSRTWHVNRVRT